MWNRSGNLSTHVYFGDWLYRSRGSHRVIDGAFFQFDSLVRYHFFISRTEEEKGPDNNGYDDDYGNNLFHVVL